MDQPLSFVSLAETVREKCFHFYIDDNIFFLRDIARTRPGSLFENAYLGLLRRLHSEYGLRFQLNIYYETPGFSLDQMPDTYKDEWAANSDWLKLSFHARADQPCDPYLNSGYDEVRKDCEAVHSQIRRFAGESVMSGFTTLHYTEATSEGVRALADCGVRGLISLCRDGKGQPCRPYYLTDPQTELLYEKGIVRDPSNGMIFVRSDLILNRIPPEQIRPSFDALCGSGRNCGFLEVMIHEQYFYRDFAYYLPDFARRIECAAEWLLENGYRPVYLDEIL